MTKDTRNQLMCLFETHHVPLTEFELRTMLAKKGSRVNKTTIYRQLAHLKEQNLIREVDFGDGKKRFELHGDDHHHHLVCTKCNKIDEIFVEDQVIQIEQKIRKSTRFKINTHSLEFFGVCKNCN